MTKAAKKWPPGWHRCWRLKNNPGKTGPCGACCEILRFRGTIRRALCTFIPWSTGRSLWRPTPFAVRFAPRGGHCSSFRGHCSSFRGRWRPLFAIRHPLATIRTVRWAPAEEPRAPVPGKSSPAPTTAMAFCAMGTGRRTTGASAQEIFFSATTAMAFCAHGHRRGKHGRLRPGNLLLRPPQRWRSVLWAPAEE